MGTIDLSPKRKQTEGCLIGWFDSQRKQKIKRTRKGHIKRKRKRKGSGNGNRKRNRKRKMKRKGKRTNENHIFDS